MSERERQTLLSDALKQALAYLETVDERPVTASADPGTLRAGLAGPLLDEGEEPLAVLRALATAARTGTVATQGPRYFGFVTGGSLPVAIAADWLVSAYDQNAALHVMSPFAAAVEEAANRYVRDIVGLPEALEHRLCHRLHSGQFHRAGRGPP